MMLEQRYSRNRYLIPCLFLLFIALFLPGNSIELPLSSNDKTVHIIIFFLVGINVFYKFKRENDRILALYTLIGFGFLSEYIQYFVPGRFMDFRDGVADAIGICLAYISYRVGRELFDKLFRIIGA